MAPFRHRFKVCLSSTPRGQSKSSEPENRDTGNKGYHAAAAQFTDRHILQTTEQPLNAIGEQRISETLNNQDQTKTDKGVSQ